MHDELFESIESHEFSALVNVASDYKRFVRALDATPEMKALCSELPSPLTQTKVLERVFDLAGRQIEPEFENPWDAALAGYLHALSGFNRDLAVLAGNAILASPNCWWAKKLADGLTTAREFHSTSSNVYKEPRGDKLFARNTSSGQSRFVVFVAGDRHTEPVKDPIPDVEYAGVGLAAALGQANRYRNLETRNTGTRPIREVI